MAMAGRLRWLSAVGIAAAAIPLTWACALQALAARDLAAGPQAASAWAGGRADLLAAVAELEADRARTPAQFAAAAGLARRALVRGPMENRALLVLALDADRRAAPQETGRLMTVLAARSLRDVQPQLWLAERALGARRYGEAFLRLDVALRRDPSLSDILYPAMGAALDDPAATAPLVDRLEGEPKWRRSFLAALAGDEDHGIDRARRLIAAMAASRAPASEAEVGDLVAAMAQAGDYRAARAIWLRLLPREQLGAVPLLYDGGFTGAPGAPPFNWRLRQGGPVVVELAATSDGAPALHLQYPLGLRRGFAEQLIVLEPGAYRLTGRTSVEAGDAPAQLVWALSCADGDETPLGEVPVSGRDGGWRAFSLAFDVPAGCQAQRLRLSALPQDGFSTVEAWFGGMAIERRPGAQAL